MSIEATLEQSEDLTKVTFTVFGTEGEKLSTDMTIATLAHSLQFLVNEHGYNPSNIKPGYFDKEVEHLRIFRNVNVQ